MKTKLLIQKLLIATILALVTGCGLANNLYTSHYTIIKDLTPHGHKVKRDGKNSFPGNGSGVVSLNFIAGNESKPVGVDTLWRKVNGDGTFSDRISLTYFNPFKDGRVESMLEPGTYFLDGLRYGYNQQHIRVGAFTSLIETNTQKGWDTTKNQPRWFSFTIKEGEELAVPDVVVSARCGSGFYSCEGSNFIISIKISDIKSANYKIGHDVELAK